MIHITSRKECVIHNMEKGLHSIGSPTVEFSQKEACLILPKYEEMEVDLIMGYLSSHISRFFVKAFFGNMSKTPVGALQDSPFPIGLKVNMKLLNELISEVGKRKSLSEENDLWQKISIDLGTKMGMNECMIDEIFVWLKRTFMRPGGIWE